MEKDILNIAINGDEKNKSEIVYNNIVNTMDKLKMTKEDQIEYLKTKITTLEQDYQNKVVILITLAISFAILCLGMYLLAIDNYLLGILFVIFAFIVVVYKLIRTNVFNQKIKNKKYIELESLRNNLNSILK